MSPQLPATNDLALSGEYIHPPGMRCQVIPIPLTRRECRQSQVIRPYDPPRPYDMAYVVRLGSQGFPDSARGAHRAGQEAGI